jgi:hypothetical protein
MSFTRLNTYTVPQSRLATNLSSGLMNHFTLVRRKTEKISQQCRIPRAAGYVRQACMYSGELLLANAYIEIGVTALGIDIGSWRVSSMVQKTPRLSCVGAMLLQFLKSCSAIYFTVMCFLLHRTSCYLRPFIRRAIIRRLQDSTAVRLRRYSLITRQFRCDEGNKPTYLSISQAQKQFISSVLKRQLQE